MYFNPPKVVAVVVALWLISQLLIPATPEAGNRRSHKRSESEGNENNLLFFCHCNSVELITSISIRIPTFDLHWFIYKRSYNSDYNFDSVASVKTSL